MLDRVRGARRKVHWQLFQGSGLDRVLADARGQNGRSGTSEYRSENCFVGRQFEVEPQISKWDAERVESPHKGGPRSGAIIAQNSVARG